MGQVLAVLLPGFRIGVGVILMPELVFGVWDQAYSDAGSGAKTTGDVAEILENRYHVMATYFDLHRDEIAEWLADSIARTMRAIAMGASTDIDPFLHATQKIQNGFKQFLLRREMAGMFAELTPAEMAYFVDKTGGFMGRASQGYSSRRKRPGQKRDPRPEFVDTGLYMASFRAEVKP